MGSGENIVKTQRTRIDEIALSDAEFVLELTQSEGWRRFIGDNGFSSVAEAETYLREGFLKSYQVHGFGYYLVSDLVGHKMGIAGFLKKKYLKFPDFGFAFLPQYQGQGFALEAAQAAFDYGVRRFMLDAVDAVTVAENTASIQLLEKLGFVEIGDVQMPEREDSNRVAESLQLYRWQA